MDIIEQGEQQTKKKTDKTYIKVLVVLLVCFIIGLQVALWVQFKYVKRIVESDELNSPNIGLVFGAGLKSKGRPSAVLEDRILTAINLYQSGKVGKFIFSGDNSTPNHNEVQAMKNFALEQGLPEDAILIDHAGVSTYESCRRVEPEFNLSKIVLITQKYHLRRALYICNELGLDATGIASANRGYANQLKYTARELVASIQAWLQINVFKA